VISHQSASMPPTNSKRKTDDEAAEARRNRQKRRYAVTLMQSFLQKINTSSSSSSSTTTNGADDPAFVEALSLCHERFLHVLAAELASNNTNTANGGVQRIAAPHVEAAMQALGMEDLLQEAQHACNNHDRAKPKKPPGRTSTKSKKHQARQFTEEELALQERLLASSKDKVAIK